MTFETLRKRRDFAIPDKYGCIYYRLKIFHRTLSGNKINESYYKQRAYAQSKAKNRYFNASVFGYRADGVVVYQRDYF